MNTRIAKKITQRFVANMASTLGYTEDQIVRAHRITGEEVPHDQLVKWREAKAARVTPPSVTTRVGIMQVTVSAGDDGKLGTADDVTTVTTVPKDPPKDYASMTVSDLKACAKELGLKGYSTLKKDDLISLLNGL
jgi:hypothetical protein